MRPRRLQSVQELPCDRVWREVHKDPSRPPKKICRKSILLPAAGDAPPLACREPGRAVRATRLVVAAPVLRPWAAAARRCVEGLPVEIERVHRAVIQGAARTVAGHD